jgi:hypothetical protein
VVLVADTGAFPSATGAPRDVGLLQMDLSLRGSERPVDFGDSFVGFGLIDLRDDDLGSVGGQQDRLWRRQFRVSRR